MKTNNQDKKIFINYALYDSRYYFDEDAALLYCECETLAEAKNAKKKMFSDAVIVKETSVEKFHKGQRILEVSQSEIVE